MSKFLDELTEVRKNNAFTEEKLQEPVKDMVYRDLKKRDINVTIDDIIDMGTIQLSIRMYALKLETFVETDVNKKKDMEELFERWFLEGRNYACNDNKFLKFDLEFLLVESLCSSLDELNTTTQELNETKIKLEAYEQQEKRLKENKTGKRSRLSSEDFQTIQRRKADGEKYKDIAPDYGYTPRTLANLIYQHSKKENGISFSDEDYQKENFTTQKKKVRKNKPTLSTQS